jgi:hypothetical protein
MVRVNLRGRFGYGRPRVYYGPGVCEVPDGLARALGLQGLAAGETEAPGDLYDGFSRKLAARLRAAYPDRAALVAATDDELLAIDGVGAATLKSLRALE